MKAFTHRDEDIVSITRTLQYLEEACMYHVKAATARHYNEESADKKA